MAMSKNAKRGLLIVGAVAVGLGIAGAASASDDVQPDDDDDDDDVPTIEDPIIFEPVDIDDDDDDPLPPPPPKCNYSGCPAFDATHKSPVFYLQRLQLLGYPVDPTRSILDAHNRKWIRHFQADSNAVRKSPPAPAASPLAFAPIAAAGALAEDGWHGEKTIAAVERAHKAVNNGGMSWGAAVELAG